jgi:uncharacterized protein (DUF885 family)
MRLRSLLVVSSFFVLASCGGSESSGRSAENTSGDARLTPVIRAYVVEFLRRNPTTNTYLGGAGFDPALKTVDGTLRDHSPAALAAEDVWLAGEKTKFEQILPATLSANARIDRDVALAQIAFQLNQHQTRKYQQRAVDTYVIEPFRAIDWQLQGMSQTGDTTYGTADEWALVIQRVRAIPAFLQAAQTQLAAGVAAGNTPDPRMIQRDGINTSLSTARYFSDTLPGLGDARISGADRATVTADLRKASADAASAYKKMRDFVAATYFTNSAATTLQPKFTADRFVMGEEQYNWALKNNLRLEKTAAQLYDESWPVVLSTQEQMTGLALQIAAARKWPLPSQRGAKRGADGRVPADRGLAVRAVFDQLSKDYPKSDTEMVAWYRDAAFRLVEFSRKTGLFDVPADYKLEVTETPPPLQASIDGAAYYPAPPFKNSGVGRFYVTPTHNDVAALQSNNRAAIADLSAHEGFPGHDWYYKVMTGARDTISPVRWLTPGAVEDSSSMWEDSMPAEGWGLYAEALMAEPQPGAPNGFYTPEEHLYQLQGQLYRDLRVRIDIGLHTGRMTYADAVDLFSSVVDFLPGKCGGSMSAAKRASCDAAERAIFRYSKWPTQAITYRLGKAQIYALREEAAKQLGARFSPKAFHLAFIRQGTIPSGYFREALLAELQRAK